MAAQLTHDNTHFTAVKSHTVLVCDGVTSPANIGGIFRLCDSFGVKEVYWLPKEHKQIDSNVNPIDDVINNAIAFAHDGTKAAIQAVTDEAKNVKSWETSFHQLRAAMAPYDSLGEAYREPGPDARKPSRLKAIEELPLALAYLRVSKGNFEDGVLGAINYGRDSDSIATMFGSLSGAMNGRQAIPHNWAETIERESRIDLVANGKKLAKIATEVAARDAQKAAVVAKASASLFGNN
mgnify:CR=1 FL=1